MVTYCLGCGDFIQMRRKDLMLCSACFENLPVFPSRVCVFSGGERNTAYIEKTMGFDQMEALYYYGDTVKSLIREFKYGGNFHAFRTLTALIKLNHQKLENVINGYDCVVTVPSHFFSIFRRGYNPAAMLSYSAIPITQNHGYITKNKFLPPMAYMSGKERKQSLKKKIYQIGKKHRQYFRGKSVLIFDDVMTTGTTIRSLAKLLRNNGTAKIGGVVLARNMQRSL